MEAGVLLKDREEQGTSVFFLHGIIHQTHRTSNQSYDTEEREKVFIAMRTLLRHHYCGTTTAAGFELRGNLETIHFSGKSIYRRLAHAHDRSEPSFWFQHASTWKIALDELNLTIVPETFATLIATSLASVGKLGWPHLCLCRNHVNHACMPLASCGVTTLASRLVGHLSFAEQDFASWMLTTLDKEAFQKINAWLPFF